MHGMENVKKNAVYAGRSEKFFPLASIWSQSLKFQEICAQYIFVSVRKTTFILTLQLSAFIKKGGALISFSHISYVVLCHNHLTEML
jgi:hypothetical protein